MLYYGAGILPITRDENGRVLFLVGRELRDNTFSDFGGKCERSDRNDPLTTAVREFVEETYGVLTEFRTLRARLGPSTAIMLRSHTQNSNAYFMYIVEIPRARHARAAFHKALSFLRMKNLKLLVEKTDLRWVTLETLLSPQFSKRGVFAQTVNLHRDILTRIASRAVPWRSACVRHARDHGFLGLHRGSDIADEDMGGTASMSWRS